MDWDNEQIYHWLTAVGLGEYVQVFRGMYVKLGITGKESSAFGGFAFPFGEVLQIRSVCFKFNFYFLGGGHFKYLYLCGGTPKIIKILVVVPQIIDGGGTKGTGLDINICPIVRYQLKLTSDK
jgi:hypothetical protein